MFDKILIANRGEIACRVLRTARRLGVRTVAVYSDADAGAQHVAQADEAYRIGPAPARQSYLDADAILEAARRSGARAVHPGYGFLSENAAFAEACAAAGLVFIGPPAAAIRAMGSKSAAKRLMGEAGVPLVPGYHGEDQAPDRLAREAARIGWPVLVKASAGGGGKGMRAVSDAAAFQDALAGAKREALASFGDDRVLLERYLTRPRHVEIQVFADGHGHAVHLFERDCSIQRRHQKVLEEAPAPGLGPALREAMGRAALAAARAVGYVGAGTVEFLLDADGRFYFMEMNTRLQVEHPVTELVTGQDLVEWQLRVAAGEPLPLGQDELALNGHAIEARVYAEDPSREFLPSIGRLTHLRRPPEGPHVRVDTGVREGDEVTIHYDPMIAKLVVWDSDRAGAVRRLRAALAEYQVVGVTTNLSFLGAIAAHPAYAAAELDTGFIERHRAGLLGDAAPATDTVLALACLDVLLRRASAAAEAARASHDPHSPWHRTDGWRLNLDDHHAVTFVDGGRHVRVVAHYRPQGLLLELPGGEVEVRGERSGEDDLVADVGGARIRATVVRSGDELVVMTHGRGHRLALHDPDQAAERDVAGGSLTAPMPGKVIAVLVEPGSAVKKGAPLLILEAMKMEHTVTSPRDGRVAEVHFAAGALVSEGAQLLALEPEPESAA
ncbi:acetyl-CoA carboxylase biotin carboxylase subunit [Anaeromyxobacter diazotrophicus]|uniref:3-methylcrotonyl-CoA carboxylase subunit alpha n=1 Tax=Anaeromyxobacter diazotrophicus TaxID=2590199 RepID=A0A7I9VIM3_9BACT|nr:acetyl/propionyl/methylcrotonyl-CoA carboxylase subunit alpha [Anaeromyxobacter diazotrophicus]GEJ55988.1 3-methylcrotonyl-CoA carboxylase subunit alpha [Anaeromyxobacter diazotrophicus]